MIHTRGGIQNITSDLLRKVLLRTDAQVAFTFECDLLLHDPERYAPVPQVSSYPLHVSSPILLSNVPFTSPQLLDTLDINTATARILEDVRFLTSSVVSLSTNPSSAGIETKFFATVRWIHSRLLMPTSYLDPHSDSDQKYQPETDPLHQTLHTASLIYTTALLDQAPLSRVTTSSNLSSLWSNMWRVPLSRWKTIPGLFFFVLLIISPFTRDKPEGRFIKGLVPATVMGIGLEDWDCLVAMLRTFLCVQRWLGANSKSGKDEAGMEISRGIPTKAITTAKEPEGGMPSWSIRE